MNGVSIAICGATVLAGYILAKTRSANLDYQIEELYQSMTEEIKAAGLEFYYDPASDLVFLISKKDSENITKNFRDSAVANGKTIYAILDYESVRPLLNKQEESHDRS